jgi:hydrogenase-4 component E
MNQLFAPLLILVLALNFVVLGVSRLRGVINAVALQGVLLGVLPLFIHKGGIELRGILLVVVTIGLKGFVIPRFLNHAMREAEIQHEIMPVVSFMTSVLLGAIGAGFAFVFSDTLPLEESTYPRLVPAALATAWTGILMLITRKKAINLVIGYLLLENGIYLFGLLLLEDTPLLVELGVLLDLFTAVFVMGIIIHHISREFASLSTEHLTELKE